MILGKRVVKIILHNKSSNPSFYYSLSKHDWLTSCKRALKAFTIRQSSKTFAAKIINFQKMYIVIVLKTVVKNNFSYESYKSCKSDLSTSYEQLF